MKNKEDIAQAIVDLRVFSEAARDAMRVSRFEISFEAKVTVADRIRHLLASDDQTFFERIPLHNDVTLVIIRINAMSNTRSRMYVAQFLASASNEMTYWRFK